MPGLSGRTLPGLSAGMFGAAPGDGLPVDRGVQFLGRRPQRRARLVQLRCERSHPLPPRPHLGVGGVPFGCAGRELGLGPLEFLPRRRLLRGPVFGVVRGPILLRRAIGTEHVRQITQAGVHVRPVEASAGELVGDIGVRERAGQGRADLLESCCSSGDSRSGEMRAELPQGRTRRGATLGAEFSDSVEIAAALGVPELLSEPDQLLQARQSGADTGVEVPGPDTGSAQCLDLRGQNAVASRPRLGGQFVPTRDEPGRRSCVQLVGERLEVGVLPHHAIMPLCHHGGVTEGFRLLVERFYAGVAQDPPLRALYPEDDLGPAAERLQLFLEQYWGGPHTYTETRGHPRLRIRHAPYAVTPAQRDRWLHHMLAALDSLELAPSDDAELRDYLVRAAQFMVNAFDGPEAPAPS